MTKNKESSLSRILRYAGNYKRLTILGCVLSAVSALLGLVPYVASGWWRGRACKLARFFRSAEDWALGWWAVWFAVGSIAVYFAALMCTHIAAFRTARTMRQQTDVACADAPAGDFSRAINLGDCEN